MPVASPVRHRRSAVVVAGVAATLLGLTGCAAGQHVQTAQQTSVVDGTAFQVGQVQLRDVGLNAPSGNSWVKGSAATLEGQIINAGRTDDQLVAVSSPDAEQVLFFTDGVPALLAAQATGSPVASATPTATATPSAAPTDSATPTSASTPTDTAAPTDTSSSTAPATRAPSPSVTPSPTVSPASDLALNAGLTMSFGYQSSGTQIVLVGLTRQIFPAETLSITFTFAGAGSVTREIAVKLPVDATRSTPTVDVKGGE